MRLRKKIYALGHLWAGGPGGGRAPSVLCICSNVAVGRRDNQHLRFRHALCRMCALPMSGPCSRPEVAHASPHLGVDQRMLTVEPLIGDAVVPASHLKPVRCQVQFLYGLICVCHKALQPAVVAVVEVHQRQRSFHFAVAVADSEDRALRLFVHVLVGVMPKSSGLHHKLHGVLPLQASGKQGGLVQQQPSQAPHLGSQPQQRGAAYARVMQRLDACLEVGPTLPTAAARPQQPLCQRLDLRVARAPGGLEAQVQHLEAPHGVLQQLCLRALLSPYHVLFWPCHDAPMADGLARPRGSDQMLAIEAHGAAVNVGGVQEVRRGIVRDKANLYVRDGSLEAVVPDANCDGMRGAQRRLVHLSPVCPDATQVDEFLEEHEDTLLESLSAKPDHVDVNVCVGIVLLELVVVSSEACKNQTPHHHEVAPVYVSQHSVRAPMETLEEGPLVSHLRDPAPAHRLNKHSALGCRGRRVAKGGQVVPDEEKLTAPAERSAGPDAGQVRVPALEAAHGARKPRDVHGLWVGGGQLREEAVVVQRKLVSQSRGPGRRERGKGLRPRGTEAVMYRPEVNLAELR
mmetsp:Transcript_70152/g.198874  ORF Transcript_70152/g.198874 Transcript_70152/m.198874 type:complete len:572 (-) Transcript_70152:326-2041(-)